MKNILPFLLKLCGQLSGFGLLGFTILGGCTSPQVKIDVVEEHRIFVDKLGKLYGAYLTGEPAQARHSLSEAIQVIEGANWLPPEDKATQLFVAYMRLFVFHRRMGEMAAADATWIKFQFWAL